MKAQRLAQLETLITQQDRTLTELHQELFVQQQEIRRLQKQLATIERKFLDRETPHEIAGQEKPPHY